MFQKLDVQAVRTFRTGSRSQTSSKDISDRLYNLANSQDILDKLQKSDEQWGQFGQDLEVGRAGRTFALDVERRTFNEKSSKIPSPKKIKCLIKNP
jgi:hypothetical protein